MQSGNRRFRVAVAVLATCLVVALSGLASPAYGGSRKVACATDTTLSVEATAAYDYGDARYLDGIISNDSTANVNCPVVEVRWLEDPERDPEQAWPRADGMAPGDWTAFHLSWPESVPSTWTAVVTARGYQTDRTALRLRVDAVSKLGGDASAMSGLATDLGSELRSYVATVTNTAAFPVSSIELIGAERYGATFLDAVWSWDEPAVLQPGQSAQIEFHAKAPTAGTPVPDVFVEARKRPVITLHADTLTPYYGTPITFTLKLTDPAGALITGGRTLKLFYSADKDNWEYVPKETETGVAAVRFAPDKPMYFKALYWGDGEWGMTESAVVRAVPRIVAAAPAAPSIVDSDKRFKVHGRMSAGAKSAGRPVYLRLHQYSPSRGRWVYKGSLKATPDSAGRFTRSVVLPTGGRWKMRAYRKGVGNSKFEYLTARW
jgi:hypothetical protein